MEDQSECVVFFEKKGLAPVMVTITVHFSYKYIKVINRLTSDPHTKKKGGDYAITRAP